MPPLLFILPFVFFFFVLFSISPSLASPTPPSFNFDMYPDNSFSTETSLLSPFNVPELEEGFYPLIINTSPTLPALAAKTLQLICDTAGDELMCCTSAICVS
ncbi:hypothetical protein MMC31_007848, partial [Peltigera leucophlebia]|nr:hypothetical protein [Peltigera leucophlebia]